jgi:hypothetical protein
MQHQPEQKARLRLPLAEALSQGQSDRQFTIGIAKIWDNFHISPLK